jgi:hypothetical protein
VKADIFDKEVQKVSLLAGEVRHFSSRYLGSSWSNSSSDLHVKKIVADVPLVLTCQIRSEISPGGGGEEGWQDSFHCEILE